MLGIEEPRLHTARGDGACTRLYIQLQAVEFNTDDLIMMPPPHKGNVWLESTSTRVNEAAITLLLALRNQHLRHVINMIRPGGLGVLIVDFVSDGTLPSIFSVKDDKVSVRTYTSVNTSSSAIWCKNEFKARAIRGTGVHAHAYVPPYVLAS